MGQKARHKKDFCSVAKIFLLMLYCFQWMMGIKFSLKMRSLVHELLLFYYSLLHSKFLTFLREALQNDTFKSIRGIISNKKMGDKLKRTRKNYKLEELRVQKRNGISVQELLFMGERGEKGTLLAEKESRVKMLHQTREKAAFRDQETRSLNLGFNVQRFRSV